MFEFNGTEYSLEQLEAIAAEKGYTFEELRNKNPEIIELGKTTPPQEDNGAAAEVNVAPKIQPTVTDSKPEDISLVLPEQPKAGTIAGTEFIPEPTSDEELNTIAKEYNKVSKIDINNLSAKKKESKIFRFNKGKFTLSEKEEYNNWKQGKGLFPESETLSQEEVQGQIQAKQTAFIADLPDYKRRDFFNSRKDIYNNQVEKYKADTKIFETEASKIENAINIANAKKSISKEEFLELNEQINTLNKKRESLISLQKNILNNEQLLDNFKRDYSKLSLLENRLKTTVTDLAMGPMALLDMMKSDEGKKISYTKDLIDYRAELAEEAEQKLAKPIEITNVSDWNTFGTWAADGLINFIPSGAMAASGPAAMPLFFASGFGSKMSDFALGKRNAEKMIPILSTAIAKAQDPKEKEKLQKQLDLQYNYINVNDITRLGTAALYGTAEFVFEIPTIKAIRDIANVSDLIAKNGFKKALAKSVAAYPVGVGMEAASEGLTTFSQNLADIYVFGDKTKSLFDGVTEASAQGALIGNGFKGINIGMVTQAAVRDVIATKADKATIKEKVNKINNLRSQLANSEVTVEEKNIIQKEIADEIKNLKDDQDISAARFLRLSKEEQQQVFEYDRLSRKEALRYSQIGASENIDENTKDQLRQEIVNKVNEYQSKKQELLNLSDQRLKPYKKIDGEAFAVIGDINRNQLIARKEQLLIEQHNKTTNVFDKIEFVQIPRDENGEIVDAYWDKDNKAIVVNEVALSQGANPHVFLHEYTHALITSIGFTKEEFDAIETDLLNEFKRKKEQGEFTEKQYNDAINKYNLYKQSKEQKLKEDASEELITAIGEQIAQNQIRKSDESFLNKIAYNVKKAIARIAGKEEADNFRIDNAEDAFNFLTQFTKSVYAKEKLRIATGGDTPEAFRNIEKEIEDEVQEFDKKLSKSKASEKVQQIYEAQGAANAFDIIAEFKPIVDKIVNKYRDVPGFEYQLLKDEIETGKRGILDMIMDYTPEKAKGAPLAAYINSLLSKRAIEAANRILGTEFTVDVTEAKGVTDTATEEATEATEEAIIADEIKSLRKEIGLPEDFITTVKNAVIKTFGTKLPNPQDPKFRLELQKRFRTELKKPMAKFVGKQEAYESFLRDNFKAIYNKLPQSLINRRFKDFAEPVLDENGKQMRERTAEGKKIFTKKKITPAEFIKYFLGSDVGRSTQGTRKTAIVEAIAEEIAFDATMEVLRDPDVINKYQDIASITGEVLPENFKSIIAKQIDRGEDFKFSKSLPNIAKEEYNLEKQELARILDKNNLNGLSNKYSLLSDNIIYEADPANIKFSLTTKAEGKWVTNPLAPLADYSKNYKFKVGDVGYEIFVTRSSEAGYDYEIFEMSNDIPDDTIINDPKSIALAFADDRGRMKITGEGITGLTNQFKVFGTVANSVIDLIKKDNLNSVTFSAKEKSRQRLYQSLNKKFADELGWDTYDFEDAEEGLTFIAYNPKALPTTTSLKFSLSSKEKAATAKIINKLQNDISKNIESEKVNFEDNLNAFIFDKFNEELKKEDLNLQEILQNVIKATNDFIIQETSGKNLISEAILNTSGELNRNYFLKIKQATGIALKKEIAELGYPASKELLNERLKEAPENKRPDIILNWFINESKSITTFNGLSDITKIQDVYNDAISDLLETYNIEGFRVGKNPKGAGKKLFFNNKPIDRYKSITDIKRNFSEYEFTINDEAKKAKKYTLDLLVYYKNNNLINKGKSHIKLLANDQIGAMRKIAKAGMYAEGLPTKKTTLEHQTTVLELTKAANDFLDNKITFEELENIFNNAQVNLITKRVDKALTAAGLKSGGKDRMQHPDVIKAFQEDLKEGIKYKNIESVYKDSKFSKSLNKEFNKILEQSSGVKFTETFSPVRATMMGRGKGKKFFIPYSADDFVGLLYATLAKGKVGDQQMEWYQENLLRPFSRGIQQYEAAKQQALRDWMELKKEVKKDVPGGLKKQNDSGFTNQDSVRLYMWNKQGMEIPGVLKKDIAPAIKAVRTNPKLKDFAERLMALNPEGYPQPGNDWASGDITTDIVSYINGVKRSEFLTEWKTNVDKIFTDKNKNKLKALYGEAYVEALDNMLYRMENGRNRFKDASKVEKAFMQWTNNSVGAIMFFNARSAVLQTLSAVNFINFSDNNPINAGRAFVNQKQYWDDFSELFNSDFLKQRRTGLQTDVNADEIANAAATSKNKARAALSAILKFGFTPTQIADSFAIASGGATFYRNRINTYIKEGLTEKEAKAKAFTDFQEIAEETQQSARPDRISMQQAGSLGRFILAFGNTPMQYARLTKKATLDLINGRGDWKTNISKIAYYSVIQNIIFSALQQGLFALLFDDEDDEETRTRLFRIGNSSFDTLLRGAGVYGAAAATVKNMILKIIDESKKSRPDYTKVAIEATAISPPINSKLRKLISAGKTFTYKQSKEKVFTEGFSLENPAFLAAGKVISAGTNLPVDRVVQKMDHINTAMEAETELWQSIALALGWSEWDLGMIEKQTKKSKKPKISIKRKSANRSGLKRTPIKRK